MVINDAVLDPNACSQWCIHRDVTGDNKCVNIQLLYDLMYYDMSRISSYYLVYNKLYYKAEIRKSAPGIRRLL